MVARGAKLLTASLDDDGRRSADQCLTGALYSALGKYDRAA